MSRMKAKAERQSYEAEAAKEMADVSSGDALEKEFENFDGSSESPAVNDKLAALKAKLAQTES